MAQRTTCPACGAPLDYSGDHDVVHCSFCETDIEVYEEAGDTRFRVLGHSDPDDREEADRVDRWNPDQGPQPQDPGDPVAPGYATTGASMADPDALSPEAVLPEVPITVDSIPEAQAHYTLRRDEPSVPGGGGGSRSRWIGIGIAVFIVVCIMCACLISIAITAGFINYSV
jgi:hypothetical protein